MTPEEERELAELEELERLEAEEARAAPPSPDRAKAAELEPKLAPTLDVMPQVLATQPATTHPGGDEAAQSEWAVRGTDAAKGTTIVYEPPLAVARQELLSNPELLQALFPSGEVTPEEIAGMDDSSPVYQAYADHKWNEARWAAADSGTTAYRQSKMPWLGGEGSGLSPLSGLVTKLRASVDPVLEGAQAFVLGMDDSAALGAGRRLTEAAGAGAFRPYTAAPSDVARGGAAVGGVAQEGRAGAGPEAVNEMLIEESPRLHTAGQIAGLFTPGGVMSLLGKGGVKLAAAGASSAAKLGGGAIAQGAGRLAGAAGAAVAGGGAVQAGREGVEAAANLGKTGETGTTLEEAAGRVEAAALDPMNLALGVGGEAAGMAAGRVARGIAESPRWQGAIERLEQLGGKIKFGKGPVGTPGAEKAIEVGKARDISPQDVIAGDISPKMTAQAKEAKEAAKIEHARFKEGFYSTREGQQVLPPTETLGTNLRMLREKMQEQPNGSLRPVGDATGVAEARAQLNADIAGVSAKPTPGAIELSPDEAEAFLSPSLVADLLPRPPGGGGGGGTPPAGKPPGGTNKQGVNVIPPGQAPTVPPKGVAAKPAGYVEKPRVVGDKPTLPVDPAHLEARNEYGEAMRPYREAQRADNMRAAGLAAEAEASDSSSLLTKSMLGAGAGLAAGAALGEEEGVAAAGAAGLIVATGKRGAAVTRILDQVSKRTAQAVKSLTDAERKAITQWSNSSKRMKEAFEAVSRTPEENALKLRKLGYSEAEIEKINFKRGEKFHGEHDEELVRDLSGAMDKLAIDNPTQYGSLHRGFGAGDEMYQMPDISDLMTKDTFVNKTPISTSYNADAVEDFARGAFLYPKQTPVLLEFKSVKRAAPRVHPDIQSLSESARQREAEVLIPPGSTFRVVSRSKRDIFQYPADHQYHNPKQKKEATVITLEQIEDAPREAWKDAAMIGAVLGAGAATGDEEGAAAAASAGGLAMALKKRGISKVYATPRRYNAQQHEVRIKQLQTLAEDPRAPGAREARELYAAALKDRRQRSLEGKPGGWAEAQKGFSDRLKALDENLEGSEYRRVVRHGTQRKGELPAKKQVEGAAVAAGVTGELRDLRLLDPLEQLRNSMQVRPGVSRTPTSVRGALGATVDAGALRFLYPGLKSAGDVSSPLRGGMLGVRANQLGDNTPEEKR